MSWRLALFVVLALAGCETKPVFEASLPSKEKSQAAPSSTQITVIEDEDSSKKPLFAEPDSLNRAAGEWAKKGDFNRAVAIYSEAIRLSPGESRLYSNRGMTFSKQNRLNEALIDFTKAIQLSPENPQLYNNRAIVYYKKKDWDRCWQDVHKKEALGGKMNAQFMSLLKQFSLREE